MKDHDDSSGENNTPPLISSESKKWQITQEGFDKLLAGLDDNRERAGEKYQELRGSLIRFFEWRGSLFPEDNADMSINRVARKLEEGEQVRDLATYSLGVSRMLLRELQRDQARQEQALNEFARLKSVSDGPPDSGRQSECLHRCLQSLSPTDRDLIVEYYRGEKRAKIENRKTLAARLGTSINTLRMRALRLRDEIEICVQKCRREV
jgi:hypothetical protein